MEESLRMDQQLIPIIALQVTPANEQKTHDTDITCMALKVVFAQMCVMQSNY